MRLRIARMLNIGRRVEPVRRCVVIVVALALLAPWAPARAADGYAIARWTIDGGGATAVEAGDYRLGGTIGQPDAGAISSGAYVLRGGFWPGVSAAMPFCIGDCNSDWTVTIDEILLGVHIALGKRPVADCRPTDHDSGGKVTVDEILLAVSAALLACP